MSTISIALEVSAESSADLHARCVAAKSAGFDYLFLRLPTFPWPGVGEILQEFPVKLVALCFEASHFATHPAEALRLAAALGVPDIALRADQPGDAPALHAAAAAAAAQGLRLSFAWPPPHAETTARTLGGNIFPDASAPGAPGVIRSFPDAAPFILLNEPAQDPAVPFGQGALPWEEVFDAAEEAAAEWYVVGEDSIQWERPASLRAAYDFLVVRA